jgi:hypothetical protein
VVKVLIKEVIKEVVKEVIKEEQLHKVCDVSSCCHTPYVIALLLSFLLSIF